MNTKNLTLIPTSNLSREEWLKLRDGYLGASDISTAMELNEFKPGLKLYLQKIGEIPADMEDNEYLFWGRYTESNIVNIWQYFDVDHPETYIQNYKDDKMICKCRRLNSMVINNDYPFLAGNLDRIINKSEKRDEGVLDAKMIGSWAANKYIGKLPPGYIVQLQIYLLITGLSYGQIALLRDGRFFSVLHFERNDTLIENVLRIAKEFNDRVQVGKALKKEWDAAILAGDKVKENEFRAKLDNNEPSPVGTPAYLEFVEERYKYIPVIITATGEHDKYYDYARQYKEACNQISSLEKDKRIAKAMILDLMKGADTLSFGIDRGEIINRPRKDGARAFYCNIK